MSSRHSPNTASIIAVGNEVVQGKVVNTNSAFLARELIQRGYILDRHIVVPDEIHAITQALDEESKRSSLICIIGGLGPTIDDRTKEAVSIWLSRDLVIDSSWLNTLNKRLGKRSYLNDNQSMIPRGAKVVENPNGTAPGIFVDAHPAHLLLLPGPSVECQAVFHEADRLGIFLSAPHQEKLVQGLRVVGAYEWEVDPVLRKIEEETPGVTFGIYPAYGYVDVTAKVSSQEIATHLRQALEHFSDLCRRKIARPIHIVQTEASLAESILSSLKAMRWTISTAESCTAGAIAQALSEVPGASFALKGGIVAYTEDIKENLLGISQVDLKKHGVVSVYTTDRMAEAARSRFSSDVAISTSGYFGPTAGRHTTDPPVGTVCISVQSPLGKISHIFQFTGTRASVLLQARGWALAMLLLHLAQKK